MYALSRRRRVLFVSLLLLLCVGVVETGLILATPALRRVGGLDIRPVDAILREQTARIDTLLETPNTLVELDSLLGWRYRAGYASTETRMNRDGLRSAREYAATRRPGVLRVAAYGDSYVYGTEVPLPATWSSVLEARDSTIEVLNYGVGGYGTDQAYLRYLRDGATHAPDIVLIGFAPVDLARAVNVYRRFLDPGELPLAKPRFVLGPDTTLRLLPHPLPTRAAWEDLRRDPRRVRALGVHDAWYEAWRYESPVAGRSATWRAAVAVGARAWRRWCWQDRLLAAGVFRTESDAFAVQRRIMRVFADSVRARGARPLIVLFPDAGSIASARRGGPAVYAPLRDLLRDADAVEVIDLLDAFVAAPGPIQQHFAPGGHYSAHGNALVAAWLHRELRRSPPP